MGMLMYGLPAKAGTRHNVGPIITHCLNRRLSPASPSPAGHYLTLMEELLPVCHLCTCCHLLQCGFELFCCALCLTALYPAVLHCVLLCCAVLCCAVLCCAVLTQWLDNQMDCKKANRCVPS